MSAAASSAIPCVWFCPSPDGPWAGLMTDLEERGLSLASGQVDEWAHHLPEGRALRRLLGDDLRRYQQTPAPLRARFAATRLLMKYVASVALCCAPTDIDLAYSAKGRAFIRGQDNTFLSLSHTADVAVVAISYLGPVGVDIERSSRELDGYDITPMMCTPPEAAELLALPPERRRQALLRTWTLKEAYTKALGQGLQFPFTEFGFDVTTRSGPAVLRRADHSNVVQPPWDVVAWRDALVPGGESYALALAAPHPETHRRMQRAPISEGGVLVDYLARRPAQPPTPSSQDTRTSPSNQHVN